MITPGASRWRHEPYTNPYAMQVAKSIRSPQQQRPEPPEPIAESIRSPQQQRPEPPEPIAESIRSPQQRQEPIAESIQSLQQRPEPIAESIRSPQQRQEPTISLKDYLHTQNITRSLIRPEHFSEIESQWDELFLHTNPLGAATELLSVLIARRLHLPQRPMDVACSNSQCEAMRVLGILIYSRVLEQSSRVLEQQEVHSQRIHLKAAYLQFQTFFNDEHIQFGTIVKNLFNEIYNDALSIKTRIPVKAIHAVLHIAQKQHWPSYQYYLYRYLQVLNTNPSPSYDTQEDIKRIINLLCSSRLNTNSPLFVQNTITTLGYYLNSLAASPGTATIVPNFWLDSLIRDTS